MGGHDWVESFLHHNLKIMTHKVQKLKCFTLNDYFWETMATMEELGVMNKPEHIYNVQEEGCKVCLHQ